MTIVIPSFHDAKLVTQLVAKIRQTTDRDRVRDHRRPTTPAAPSTSRPLRRIAGIEVLAADQRRLCGQRQPRPAGRRSALMTSCYSTPTCCRCATGWRACSTPRRGAATSGSSAPSSCTPTTGSSTRGRCATLAAPEWFDHRYRFKPGDWGPANVAGPTLAATGACMYITREVLDQVGLFDEDYGMGYEDVDYCLRAWQAGFQVVYAPSAQLHHHESITRGTEVGERERSRSGFSGSAGARSSTSARCATDDGKLRVVYVTEDTVVGGGHRDVFEHLNGLIERGHDAQLWTLGAHRTGSSCDAPSGASTTTRSWTALAPLEAIKVATWWNTSTRCGGPAS